MKSSRQKTDIVVKVVDFSKEARSTEKEYKTKHDIDCEIDFSSTGYIEVGGNKYMIDTDGIISVEPLSKENTWITNMFRRVKNGDKTNIQTQAVEVTPDDVNDIANEVNLADFVRSFGSRLEHNYKGVIDFVKELREKELTPSV